MFRTLVARRTFVNWSLGALIAAPLRVLADSDQDAAAGANRKAAFRGKAVEWARQGLALQRADGTNPEKGGYDTGYQMVGVLMSLRYLPVCADLQRALATARLTSADGLLLRSLSRPGPLAPAHVGPATQQHRRQDEQPDPIEAAAAAATAVAGRVAAGAAAATPARVTANRGTIARR